MLRNPIIASLDGLSKEETIAAIKELWGNGNRRVWGFKIDTLLLTEGVDVLDELQKKAEAGNLVIDLPIIGTPDLIRRSVQLLSHSTVSHIVCNAMAGPSAIREAIKAASISKILVGSVLSSFDIADIKFIFGHVYREVPSYEFAELAKNTKAAGFFCATEELDFLSRKPESRDILKMVVGVRP
ncbi:MAG: orotidine 5'-phosphate decarboxylase / HUMPS family protein, partial [Parcubacteria group bacterium]